MPSARDLEVYYGSGAYDHGDERISRGDTGLWAHSSRRAHAQVQLVHQFTVPRSWLDIGAGYGHLLDEAKQRGAARTAAVEPTPLRFDEIVARGHDAYKRLSDVEGTWNVVSFSHVLEHIDWPLRFLGEVRERLSPSGVVFCEVPNRPLENDDADEPHVLFFDPESMTRLMANAGLTVVLVTGAGPRLRPSRLESSLTYRFAWAGARLRLPQRIAFVHPDFWRYSGGRLLRVVARAS